MRPIAFVALLVALFAVAPAHAVPVSFSCIQSTPNSPSNCATGEAQIRADVEFVGPGQVSFLFRNVGPNAGSITDIYFDDGTLLGITSVQNGPGVAFTPWSTTTGVEPGNLPGGNLISPPFQTTKGFSADSDLPSVANGVNPGEWVRIYFNLINGMEYEDTVNALNTGVLRIGVYMRGFSGAPGTCGEIHPCGGEASFVNNPVRVPEAPVLLLIGSGFIAAGVAFRRSRP